MRAVAGMFSVHPLRQVEAAPEGPLRLACIAEPFPPSSSGLPLGSSVQAPGAFSAAGALR